MIQGGVAHQIRIPAVSTCPGCGNEQVQWFSHLALSTRLLRGQPIEGYCAMCQAHWQLDSHERSALAAKLADSCPQMGFDENEDAAPVAGRRARGNPGPSASLAASQDNREPAAAVSVSLAVLRS
jgi:hypothetical protein